MSTHPPSDAPSMSGSPSLTAVTARVSPPPDLRRLTSNGQLAPHPSSSPTPNRGLSPRNSVHIGARGTLSPAASIPSSPTSVHSSSSAIFERDVEPVLSMSLTAAAPSSPTVGGQAASPPNQHLIPRSKGTEAVDQTVPSVLDSAATLLVSSSPDDLDVSVVAPAPNASLSSSLMSATGSPMRSRGTSPGRSRSPSPMNRFSTAGLEQSLLLHLPSSTGAGSPPAGSPPARPTIHTEKTVTQIPRADSLGASGTPQSTAYFSSASSAVSSHSSSPTAMSHDRAPELPTPTSDGANAASKFASPATSPPQLSPQNSSSLADPSVAGAQPRGRLGIPPSPTKAAKRLSFMSYADLLTSTPASTVPLSSLTAGATQEPPPHIPSVMGLAGAALSGETDSITSSVHGRAATGHGHGFGGPTSSHAARSQRESVLLMPGAPDEAGGEWEREGLGSGMEERLEALMGTPSRSPAVLATHA